MRAAEKAQDKKHYTLVFEEQLTGSTLNINLANTRDQVLKKTQSFIKS